MHLLPGFHGHFDTSMAAAAAVGAGGSPVAEGTVFSGEAASPPNHPDVWRCQNKFTVTLCAAIQLPADDPVAAILGEGYAAAAAAAAPAAPSYRFEGIMESTLDGFDLGAIRCPGELIPTDEEGMYRFNVLGGARLRGDQILCPARYVGELRRDADGRLTMSGSWGDPLQPLYTGPLELAAE